MNDMNYVISAELKIGEIIQNTSRLIQELDSIEKKIGSLNKTIGSMKKVDLSNLITFSNLHLNIQNELNKHVFKINIVPNIVGGTIPTQVKGGTHVAGQTTQHPQTGMVSGVPSQKGSGIIISNANINLPPAVAKDLTQAAIDNALNIIKSRKFDNIRSEKIMREYPKESLEIRKTLFERTKSDIQHEITTLKKHRENLIKELGVITDKAEKSKKASEISDISEKIRGLKLEQEILRHRSSFPVQISPSIPIRDYGKDLIAYAETIKSLSKTNPGIVKQYLDAISEYHSVLDKMATDLKGRIKPLQDKGLGRTAKEEHDLQWYMQDLETINQEKRMAEFQLRATKKAYRDVLSGITSNATFKEIGESDLETQKEYLKYFGLTDAGALKNIADEMKRERAAQKIKLEMLKQLDVTPEELAAESGKLKAMDLQRAYLTTALNAQKQLDVVNKTDNIKNIFQKIDEDAFKFGISDEFSKVKKQQLWIGELEARINSLKGQKLLTLPGTEEELRILEDIKAHEAAVRFAREKLERLKRDELGDSRSMTDIDVINQQRRNILHQAGIGDIDELAKPGLTENDYERALRKIVQHRREIELGKQRLPQGIEFEDYKDAAQWAEKSVKYEQEKVKLGNLELSQLRESLTYEQQKLDLKQKIIAAQKAAIKTGKDQIVYQQLVDDFGRKSAVKFRVQGSTGSVLRVNPNEDNYGLESVFKRMFRNMIVWDLVQMQIFGVTMALREAIRTMAEFEKQMVQVRQVIEQSPKGYTFNVEKLSSEAIDIAKKYGIVMTDVSATMYDFAKQNYTQNEVLKLTEQSMIAATISGMKYNDINELLIATMKQFNMEERGVVQASKDIINTWAYLANTTAASMKDIAEGIADAGSAAKNLRVDFELASALIANTINITKETGPVIGKAFAMMAEHIQDERTIEALQEIGVAVQKDAVQFRSLYSILDDLHMSWDKLTKAQKSNIASYMMGGPRRARQFMGMMQAWEKTKDDWARTIPDNYAERLAVQTLDTLGGSMERLGATFHAIFINLGNLGFFQIIKVLADSFTFLGEGVSNFLEIFKEVPVAFRTGFAAIMGFAGILKVLDFYFKKVRSDDVFGANKGVYEILQEKANEAKLRAEVSKYYGRPITNAQWRDLVIEKRQKEVLEEIKRTNPDLAALIDPHLDEYNKKELAKKAQEASAKKLAEDLKKYDELNRLNRRVDTRDYVIKRALESGAINFARPTWGLFSEIIDRVKTEVAITKHGKDLRTNIDEINRAKNFGIDLSQPIGHLERMTSEMKKLVTTSGVWVATMNMGKIAIAGITTAIRTMGVTLATALAEFAVLFGAFTALGKIWDHYKERQNALTQAKSFGMLSKTQRQEELENLSRAVEKRQMGLEITQEEKDLIDKYKHWISDINNRSSLLNRDFSSADILEGERLAIEDAIYNKEKFNKAIMEYTDQLYMEGMTGPQKDRAERMQKDRAYFESTEKDIKQIAKTIEENLQTGTNYIKSFEYELKGLSMEFLYATDSLEYFIEANKKLLDISNALSLAMQGVRVSFQYANDTLKKTTDGLEEAKKAIGYSIAEDFLGSEEFSKQIKNGYSELDKFFETKRDMDSQFMKQMFDIFGKSDQGYQEMRKFLKAPEEFSGEKYDRARELIADFSASRVQELDKKWRGLTEAEKEQYVKLEKGEPFEQSYFKHLKMVEENIPNLAKLNEAYKQYTLELKSNAAQMRQNNLQLVLALAGLKEYEVEVRKIQDEFSRFNTALEMISEYPINYEKRISALSKVMAVVNGQIALQTKQMVNIDEIMNSYKELYGIADYESQPMTDAQAQYNKLYEEAQKIRQEHNATLLQYKQMQDQLLQLILSGEKYAGVWESIEKRMNIINEILKEQREREASAKAFPAVQRFKAVFGEAGYNKYADAMERSRQNLEEIANKLEELEKLSVMYKDDREAWEKAVNEMDTKTAAEEFRVKVTDPMEKSQEIIARRNEEAANIMKEAAEAQKRNADLQRDLMIQLLNRLGGSVNTIEYERQLEGEEEKLKQYQKRVQGQEDIVGDEAWRIIESYARKYNTSPELLAAIGQHETGWGRLGAGRQGYYMGVGVPDSGELQTEFRGLHEQLDWAAKTVSKFYKGDRELDWYTLERIRTQGYHTTDPGWTDAVLRYYNKYVTDRGNLVIKGIESYGVQKKDITVSANNVNIQPQSPFSPESKYNEQKQKLWLEAYKEQEKFLENVPKKILEDYYIGIQKIENRYRVTSDIIEKINSETDLLNNTFDDLLSYITDLDIKISNFIYEREVLIKDLEKATDAEKKLINERIEKNDEQLRKATELRKVIEESVDIYNKFRIERSPKYNIELSNIARTSFLRKLSQQIPGTPEYNYYAEQLMGSDLLDIESIQQQSRALFEKFGIDYKHYLNIETKAEEIRRAVRTKQLEQINDEIRSASDHTRKIETLIKKQEILNEYYAEQEKRVEQLKDLYMSSGEGYSEWLEKASALYGHSLWKITQAINRASMDIGIGSNKGIVSLNELAELEEQRLQLLDKQRDSLRAAFLSGHIGLQAFVDWMKRLRDTAREIREQQLALYEGTQNTIKSSFTSALTSAMTGNWEARFDLVNSLKEGLAGLVAEQVGNALMSSSLFQPLFNQISSLFSGLAGNSLSNIANILSGPEFKEAMNETLSVLLPLMEVIADSTKGIFKSIKDNIYNAPHGFRIEPYLYEYVKVNQETLDYFNPNKNIAQEAGELIYNKPPEGEPEKQPIDIIQKGVTDIVEILKLIYGELKPQEKLNDVSVADLMLMAAKYNWSIAVDEKAKNNAAEWGRIARSLGKTFDPNNEPGKFEEWLKEHNLTKEDLKTIFDDVSFDDDMRNIKVVNSLSDIRKELIKAGLDEKTGLMAVELAIKSIKLTSGLTGGGGSSNSPSSGQSGGSTSGGSGGTTSSGGGGTSSGKVSVDLDDYLKVRTLESYGYDIYWDEAAQKITISKDGLSTTLTSGQYTIGSDDRAYVYWKNQQGLYNLLMKDSRYSFYHEGGYVSPFGPIPLRNDEVPIIARRGELFVPTNNLSKVDNASGIQITVQVDARGSNWSEEQIKAFVREGTMEALRQAERMKRIDNLRTRGVSYR